MPVVCEEQSQISDQGTETGHSDPAANCRTLANKFLQAILTQVQRFAAKCAGDAR